MLSPEITSAVTEHRIIHLFHNRSMGLIPSKPDKIYKKIYSFLEEVSSLFLLLYQDFHWTAATEKENMLQHLINVDFDSSEQFIIRYRLPGKPESAGH